MRSLPDNIYVHPHPLALLLCRAMSVHLAVVLESLVMPPYIVDRLVCLSRSKKIQLAMVTMMKMEMGMKIRMEVVRCLLFLFDKSLIKKDISYLHRYVIIYALHKLSLFRDLVKKFNFIFALLVPTKCLYTISNDDLRKSPNNWPCSVIVL